MLYICTVKIEMMEKDDEFLKRAADLFLEVGAKTLTMDDVAKEFGMSKKTLYQKYRNKEALLEDVLNYKLKYVIHKIEALDRKVENAIERVFCRDEAIDQAVQSNQSVMIRQLIRYYPTIFYSHMKRFAEKFSQVMVRNIEKGRAQGLYRTDFNAELYSKFFLQLAMSYDSSPFFEEEKSERMDFMQEVILMYIHAITTEEGKKELIRINKQNNETN